MASSGTDIIPSLSHSATGRSESHSVRRSGEADPAAMPDADSGSSTSNASASKKRSGRLHDNSSKTQAQAAAEAVASALRAGAKTMDDMNGDQSRNNRVGGTAIFASPQGQQDPQQSFGGRGFFHFGPPFDSSIAALLMNPHAGAAATTAAHHSTMQQSPQHATPGPYSLQLNSIILPSSSNTDSSDNYTAQTNASQHGNQEHVDPALRNSNPNQVANGEQRAATSPAPQSASSHLPFSSQAAALLASGGMNGGGASVHQAAFLAAVLTAAQKQQQQHQQQMTHHGHTSRQASHCAPPSSAAPTPTPGVSASSPFLSPSVTGIGGSATVAAQAVAAHAAATTGVPGGMSNALLAGMRNWKLDQLEAHVKLLRDSNQPVPQPITLLLAEARRKEEKRNAKRVANRKSACTSRARKKALVEEMTRTNARLRRQALILALLPDLVVAIKMDGEITFCSAQVERVLKHKIDNLIGANLSSILVPGSQAALNQLIEELVAAEQAASSSLEADENLVEEYGNRIDADNAGGSASAQSSANLSAAAIVSDQSFPLSVVNVENLSRDKSSGEEETSDLSTGKEAADTKATRKSSTKDKLLSRSLTKSLENSRSGADEVAPTLNTGEAAPATQGDRRCRPGANSSADSLSSSFDVRNVCDADNALDRNVRSHNAKLASKKSEHTDDVTGASVTANNADARLSSLQHHPRMDKTAAWAGKKSESKKAAGRSSSSLTFESTEEQSYSSSSDFDEKKKRNLGQRKGVSSGTENVSEDSGYRESSESLHSPEDSSSEASSSSRNGRRPKPLAPTCNICLIRDDLTTIWCEVTSSIRTRSLEEEIGESSTASASGQAAVNSSTTNGNKSSKDSPEINDDPPELKGEIKELLLCLRPIRDGGEVGEELRFRPYAEIEKGQEDEGQSQEAIAEITVSGNVSNRAGICSSSGNCSPNDVESGPTAISELRDNGPMKKRPPRKRPIATGYTLAEGASSNSSVTEGEVQQSKKSRICSSSGSISPDQATDTEKSVVESLMLMSNNRK